MLLALLKFCGTVPMSAVTVYLGGCLHWPQWAWILIKLLNWVCISE